MKVLVVIFAVLSMLASSAMGALISVGLSEAAQKKGMSLEKAEALNRELAVALESDRSLDKETKKKLVKDLDEQASLAKNLRRLPFVFFGVTALGLLMMILCLANAGPKALHGIAFILIALIPIIFTFRTLRTIENAEARIGRSRQPLALKPQDVKIANIAVAGTQGGFVLAGIFAFLVTRKSKTAV